PTPSASVARVVTAAEDSVNAGGLRFKRSGFCVPASKNGARLTLNTERPTSLHLPRHSGIRLFKIQTLHSNNRLGAGTHAQLAENRGNVGLNGGFADVQIVSDLFVQHTFRHHA